MRSQAIKSELNRIIDVIREDNSVEKVFLFGSMARNSAIKEDSDIDICVIQNTDLRFYDRLALWINRIQPKIGMDLVVYTPDEFSSMSESNYFVRNEIIRKGREVHAA